MPDPVIAAHEALPNFFLLSGHGPISIRDQLLRARMLIDRLIATKRLKAPDPGVPSSEDAPQLLVIGAGGAGVTAALRAAERKIKTCLVEKYQRPFGTLSLAFSRHLCPTQYDWPNDIYTGGIFPQDGDETMPLHVDSNSRDRVLTGQALAFLWRQEARKKHKQIPSHLLFRPQAKVVTVCVVDGKLTAKLVSNEGSEDIQAPVMIWAAGFGKEECTLYQTEVEFPPEGKPKVKRKFKNDVTKPPYYVGRPFWSNDDLVQLTSDNRVLIAGAGDGALQDFIRVATGMDLARDVLHKLNVPEHVTKKIHSAEERLFRARWWHGDGAGLGPYMHEVETRYRSLIKQELDAKDNADAEEDPPFLKRVRDFLAERSIPRILLVYPQPYLKAYYALNRFLVLLIDEFFQHPRMGLAPGTVSLMRNVHLWALEREGGAADLWEFVEGQDGKLAWRAKGDWQGSILLSADAEEGHWFQPVFSLGGPPSKFNETFDRIVVRFGHGENRPPLIQWKAGEKPKRYRPPLSWHMLPYHFPQ